MESECSFNVQVRLRVKFHHGMKSSLSMVKCDLLFTRFSQDEIYSRNGKKKKDVQTLHPRMKFYNLTYVLNMLSKFKMFEHQKNDNIGPFHKK